MVNTKNEKFIKEVYDKSKDKEVFDEAIDRVGDKMIEKLPNECCII